MSPTSETFSSFTRYGGSEKSRFDIQPTCGFTWTSLAEAQLEYLEGRLPEQW